ncbi:helix-turn-helix domain-containing protein [Streptomyces sp. CB01881]|uniref:AraC-like ligand-binding domain-containing protein n=1 Tax=Streptomyces sp. CB01881 TaxID=2078691 RepID=UPI001F11D5C3|nr:helix-turn-helix domain-containing protein [Streptomyces sp. CB01881]
MKASVSTTSVSARDGFEWWTHMVGDLVMPVSVTSTHADRFRGTATSIPLGDTDIFGFTFSPMSARRAVGHIRRGDPEQYFLFLVHGSPIGIDQRRNTSLLTAGDIALFDSSHPLSCEFQDEGRLPRVTLLRIPRSALPLSQDRTDRLLGTALPAHTVPGTLLASYLTELRSQAERCEPAELRRLGGIALDLTAALLASASDSTLALPAETRREVLLAQIGAFIDRNLADPDLGPAGIAAHHHISVRALHQLFRSQPETVAATVRRRRLERCRADLADSRLRDRPIGPLAARWGFLLPAEFSRAFRAAYGVTPTEFRHGAAARPPRSAPRHK